MVLNEVLVIPTPETLRRLSTIMSACPFEINLRETYVSLNISEDSMTPDSSRIYEARAGNLGIWYDQSTGYSSLIMPLVSPTMAERVMELREEAPNFFYGDRWVAFMVLVRDMPPVNRRKSGFINSVSNSLAWEPMPMTFTMEFVRPIEVTAPPYADYYAANQANERSLARW